ncbi:DUF1453 domain-containing protein [Nonomuraea zeae]|uniref:DUF1453 domain-containing protein n=1 Tax=Nonomuraea zeae TaxID=1642303 RepID=A0A5S4G6F8_9ACTN|nr:DUF1453 domain-containing protein [Nonomuraea zeae]TMR28605.1 DUF1453 domain-containing protein [Nonomuraea zeae]
MDVLQILLIVGAVAYVVARRFAGQPLVAKDVYVPPVILAGIGVHGLAGIDLSALDAGWLAVTTVLGVGFGALRAGTTVVYRRDGVLWQRYTWKTLVVWVVTFVMSFGVGALAVATGMHAEARSVPLSIGVGLLGEALVILLRSRAAGVPFAPGRR